VIWDGCIPLNTDIVISHTPPKYHCDESRNRGPAGCEALRQKLWRVRPSLAICGHVHEGRGVERVLWDLETPNVKYKETATGYWTDAGLDSKKQSLVDLSAKSRVPLDNTDNWDDTYPTTGNALLNMSIMEPSQPWRLDYSSSYQHDNESHSAVWGQGGTPPSGRCDVEALEGRMGRRETCVVNASIMTFSWPYKSKNQRRYNKPIVVDIDLPVRPHEGQNPSTDLPTESDHSFLSENGTMSDEAVYSSLSS